MTGTDASRFGQRLHAILEHFEGAAKRLRDKGFSDYTANRVGMFVTLCAHDWTISQAWSFVNESFPTDPLATQHAGMLKTPATDPTSTQPDSKGPSHAARI